MKSNPRRIDHLKYFRRYAALKTLFSLHTGFIGAIYVVYFYGLGFSKLTVNALSSIFMIAVFLMEIPLGAFADVFGKRKALICSGILLAVSMLLFFISKSFIFLAISQFLWGLSYAFESGTSESWIINKLEIKEENLDKLFARSSKLSGIFIAIGGCLGGILSDIDVRLPWVLSFITAIVFTIFVILYVERDDFKTKKIGFKDGFLGLKNVISSSITYGFKDKITRRLILLNLVLAFCFSPVFVFWSPYLKELSQGGFVILGQVWILIKISNVIGNYLIERIVKFKIARITTITVTIFIASLSVLFMGIIQSFVLVLIFFLLFEITLGIFLPVIKAYINDRLPNEIRSTILSFVSMLTRGSNFLSLYVMGFFSDHFGIPASLVIAGSILLLCGITIPLIIIHNNKNGIISSNNH